MMREIYRWLSYRPDHVAAGISGGLGNQLFQFAAGKALALRLGLPLKIDYEDGIDSFGRRFLLDRMGVKATRLSVEERLAWLGPDSGIATQRWPCRLIEHAFLHRRVVERWPDFDQDLLDRRTPALLHGCWQSARYFADQWERIAPDLNSDSPRSGNMPGIDGPSHERSVALHVRRGDYLQSGVQAVLGNCSLAYYERAVAQIQSRIGSPNFLLFTDDPEWVARQPSLERLGPIVGPNTAEPVADLRLMARCRHFIVANSSFSWWAAWLGARHDSTVICPDPWFASAPQFQSCIVPRGWHSIPIT